MIKINKLSPYSSDWISSISLFPYIGTGLFIRSFAIFALSVRLEKTNIEKNIIQSFNSQTCIQFYWFPLMIQLDLPCYIIFIPKISFEQMHFFLDSTLLESIHFLFNQYAISILSFLLVINYLQFPKKCLI